jgi:hypothetical protein
VRSDARATAFNIAIVEDLGGKSADWLEKVSDEP